MNSDNLLITVTQNFQAVFSQMPIIAILRGIQPNEIKAVAEILIDSGISLIEVPLGKKYSLEATERLAGLAPPDCLIGCGTLVEEQLIRSVSDAGAQIVVTPNSNPEIIKKCIQEGLLPIPGWMSPTEAFAAIDAGAVYLKLFPAHAMGSSYLKAVKTVLPDHANIIAVGGVQLQELDDWKIAGAAGFGFGSELYTPGRPLAEIRQRAVNIVTAVREVYAD